MAFDAGKPAPMGVAFLTVTVVFTVLATIAVALRIYSRRIKRQIGPDDWTIMFALVLDYGFLAVAAVLSTAGGVGHHIDEFNDAELHTLLAALFANDIMYAFILTATKLSILLLYRRIFTNNKPFAYAVYSVAFLVIGWFLSHIFGLVFSYSPVQAQWKPEIPHTTIAILKFYLGIAISNILTDVIILCLPLPMIYRLHLNRRKKFMLTGVFMLGSFVCIASIVRIVYLETIDFEDASYSTARPGLWTQIEVNTAIICACLPTLPQMFRHWYELTKSPDSKDGSGSWGRLIWWLRSSRNSILKSLAGSDENEGLPSGARQVVTSSETDGEEMDFLTAARMGPKDSKRKDTAI